MAQMGEGAPGHYPSSLAYALLECGALVCRHPRGRWKAQGAGRIGGAIFADLWRARWVRPQTFHGRTSPRYEITAAGRAVLAEHDTNTTKTQTEASP